MRIYFQRKCWFTLNSKPNLNHCLNFSYTRGGGKIQGDSFLFVFKDWLNSNFISLTLFATSIEQKSQYCSSSFSIVIFCNFGNFAALRSIIAITEDNQESLKSSTIIENHYQSLGIIKNFRSICVQVWDLAFGWNYSISIFCNLACESYVFV